MKLVIAIPALDEEDAIGGVVQACLDARDRIVAETPVDEVEVTVVSDGSTDRTVEIARGFGDRIGLVVFERNRGYGAAIQEAWRRSDADLLGFLDGDGTCDPEFFVPLCRTLLEQDADLVLGCRMTSESRMPALRRFGNRLFATLMSLIALERVRDSASGMRVVRRSRLPRLLPLPSGLHFTPAMSARAVMSRDLRLVEVDMPYRERAGASKLRALEDGLRFLRVILQASLLYRPGRIVSWAAVALAAVVAVLVAGPFAFWWRESRLLEWMIYRLLVAQTLAILAVLTVCVTYLAQKAADISLSGDPLADRYHGVMGWLFSRRWFPVLPALLVVAGVAFVWDALLRFLDTGEVTEHWSRFVALLFCLTVAGVLVLTRLVDHAMNLLAERVAWMRGPDGDEPS